MINIGTIEICHFLWITGFTSFGYVWWLRHGLGDFFINFNVFLEFLQKLDLGAWPPVASVGHPVIQSIGFPEGTGLIKAAEKNT